MPRMETAEQKPVGEDPSRTGGSAARPCVVCSSSDGKVIFTEFGVDILRCRKCGHVYSTHPTPQDFDGYFGEVVEGGEQFWWDAAHRRMYSDFGERFLAGKQGSILDVGCGLGYFVRSASGFPNWQVSGFEISPAATAYARDKLGLQNVRCGRVQESGFPPDHFDIITLWDVIEHIPQPDLLLTYLAMILKKDGFLFLHTPNEKVQVVKAKLKRLLKGMRPDEHYLEARDHMNIYSPNTIRKVLQRTGFRRVDFVHLHPVQSLGGSRSVFLRCIKNLWFHSARALDVLTCGQLNLDNLFVVARKGS